MRCGVRGIRVARVAGCIVGVDPVVVSGGGAEACIGVARDVGAQSDQW